MKNTMTVTQKRQMSVSALLLFLVFVTVCPIKAQLLIGPAALMPGKTVRRPTDRVLIRAKPKFNDALEGVTDSKGKVVLNLSESDFRTAYNLVPQTIDSPSSGNAPLSAAMQVPYPSITPPGIFDLPPIPGAPQTPATEARRASNINLGALASWIRKHAGR